MQTGVVPTEQALRRAKGKEYTLHHKEIVKDKNGVEHRLYIICKSLRTDENTSTPIAFYYIIDGVIFQAPVLYDTLNSRVVSFAPITYVFFYY